MAICGRCQTSCTCNFANGSGTLVSGVGTLASPFKYEVITATWPFSCSSNLGTPLYLDEQNRIVGVPDHTSSLQIVTESNIVVTPIQTNNVTTYSDNITTLTFTNPSYCRDMLLFAWTNSQFLSTIPPPAAFQASLRTEIQVNGTGWQSVAANWVSPHTAWSTQFYQHVHRAYPLVVSAGDSVVFDLRSGVTWYSGTAANQKFTCTHYIVFYGRTM